MPKNQVTDPITDKEIAFAHLVLAGTMTDRRAAEAVGLNPDTAAYTKAKPRVRTYMLEHRAAVHEQRVQQETEELRRLNQSREQVLARLWEIANLDPEMTRNSASAQIKALSMIIAIEGLISDRRAGSSEKKSASPPAAWLREQQEKPPAPTLSETKMCLAFPIHRSGRRLTSSEFNVARPDSPAAVHFCSRQPGPILYNKDPRYLAPETLKETHTLPMPQKIKKDRILSNFTKSTPTEP